jgi:hypothetical protein
MLVMPVLALSRWTVRAAEALDHNAPDHFVIDDLAQS